MNIKKLAAATMILCVLAAFPAVAAADPVDDSASTELRREDATVPGENKTPENNQEIKPGEKGAPENFEKQPPRKIRYRKKAWDEFVKDPLKVLENRKNEIEELLNEGKISKDKAEAILKKIDAAIAEIKKFNNMSLEEKRDRLIKDCKDYLENLVEKGEMDKEKASEILEKYSDKIKKWDGTGYPRFFRKPGKPEKR